MKVQVLLAVYNGKKFIRDQIFSLLNQNISPEINYSILISEDGSSESIRAYVESLNDERLIYLCAERKGGVTNNFKYLLDHASDDADLLFFADQDDFWLPNKISTFIDRLNLLTAEEKNKPILIHSDLCIVDADLYPVNTSMFKFQKLNKNPSFSNLLIQNSITGCVTAINNYTLRLARDSLITESIMHDWYIALIVLATDGNVLFIEKPTILYRQHTNNQLGAKNAGIAAVIGNIFCLNETLKKAKKSIFECKKQTELLLSDDVLIESFSPKKRQDAIDFAKSFDGSIYSRLRLFLWGGISKCSIIKNMVFVMLYVFLLKGKFR